MEEQMPQRTGPRAALIAAIVAAALATSLPSHAVLPVVAALGKQFLKDMLIDGVKSQLIGSLAGMGCKGAATASLLASTGNPRAALSGALAVPGAMPTMPAGMPAMPAMAAGGRAMDPAQANVAMQQLMGSRAGAMPAMPAMSPDQAAQMAHAMQAMQQAMAQPLSRAETLQVFDEMSDLGLLSPAMRAEARDCVTLAPPGANVGMAGAMLKNMMLPQLRTARETMASLTPEERTQLADEIVEGLKEASPEDRKTFQDGFGLGFFPPDVVERVKTKLR
jgi:hypothetical protein